MQTSPPRREAAAEGRAASPTAWRDVTAEKIGLCIQPRRPCTESGARESRCIAEATPVHGRRRQR
eukprot:9500980-Pyramimonas_sp.AAC.1